jgi:hypothetical protein
VLVASEFPFAKIVGVEISRELSGIAEQNVMRHRSISQRCTTFSLHCADSTDYTFESEPLVLFLFNPFGRESVRRVLAKLEASLVASPRAAYLIYVNPRLRGWCGTRRSFERSKKVARGGDLGAGM